MNKIKNVIRNLRKSENAINLKKESVSTLKVETEEYFNKENNYIQSNFDIPEILNYFPEMIKKEIFSTSLKGDVGHLICGTISSYFEDTWSKSIEELKKNKIKFNENNFSEFAFGIYLKREWHRLWLIRNFLAFCWENYLEDILKINEHEEEYIKLPCYGTELKNITKIPLGEIACIVGNSFLSFIHEYNLTIPFSTIQGRIINKETIYVNKLLHWKTPPPNSIAKFKILNDKLKIESNEIYFSLDIDKPKLLWRNTISDIIPKEFDDNQLISSCIRVLRKDEIGKFIINQRTELTIQLLHWYNETSIEIKYKEASVICKFIVEDFQIGKESLDQVSIQYFITSNYSRERKLFNIKISNYIENTDSFLIKSVLEKNKKVVVYLTLDLLINELRTLKPFSENLKLINTFENILNGLKDGKEYFLHIEKLIEKRDNGNTLLLEHILLNKKYFEYRYKILYDLFTFGKLVLPKLEIEENQWIIIQDIFIKNLGNNNFLVDNLRIKFENELFNNNLFQIPYILIDFEKEFRSTKNAIYFISPCIKNNNELLFYSLFEKLKTDKIDKKLFNIGLNTKYNKLLINDIKQARIEYETMSIFYYNKGISLIKEIGGFDFNIESQRIAELTDNRSLGYLNMEIDMIRGNIEKVNNANNRLGLFCHLIRTCFFIFHEKYDNSNFSELNLVNLRQLLDLEIKKKNNYFKSIGTLTEILLDIEIGDKVQVNLIESIINMIIESMRHISIMRILLYYLITWILLHVLNYNIQVNTELTQKKVFQNLLKFHRVCRQFINKNQKEIEKYLKISKKSDIDGILRVKLPVKIYQTFEQSNKSFFFKLFFENKAFEYLLKLMDSNYNGIIDSSNDKYYNLLKDDSNYCFLSIGNNKNGSLGIGLPKINLFSDIECKLFPNLNKINQLYFKRGIESDYVTHDLQTIIFKDNFLLEKGILSICSGTDHILILKKNGSLISWGNNSFGQCCQKKNDINLNIYEFDKDRNTDIFKKKIEEYENLVPYPTDITYFSDLTNRILISKISCGSNFSLAVDTNGNLFSWGQGKDGCLGNGTFQDSFIPQKIYFDFPIKIVSSGMFHCGAIDINDQLYLWGSNEFGQLGIQLYENNKIIPTPYKINIGFSYDDISNMKIIIQNSEGINRYLKKQNFTHLRLVKWKEISLGEIHSIALDNQGIIWVWGQNNFKQLTIIPKKLNLKFIIQNEKDVSEYYKKLDSMVSLPTPLISTSRHEVFNRRKINMIISGSAACCAIDEFGKPWIWGLTFSGIDNHFNSSFLFSKTSNIRSKQLVELKEIEVPVRVFRNMTTDDDSIKTIRFGKGNNNISMISKYGKCYLWLENKDLIIDQMKYSGQHNCYVIYNLVNENSFDDQYSVSDITLLSDSIIIVAKKSKIN